MSDFIPSEDGAPADLRTSRRRKITLNDPSAIDRIPPNSREAEQGIIGCALLDPYSAITTLQASGKFSPEIFYDLRHRAIWDALYDLYTKQQPIDLITIVQRLKDSQQLEGVGGMAYLSSLPDAVPSAANLSYYAEIAFEKYILRKIIVNGTDAAAKAYECDDEVSQLIDEVERDTMAVSALMYKPEMLTAKELVAKAMASFERYIEVRQSGQLPGIPSGFTDMDNLLLGLQLKEMIVVGARPSVGKSTLLGNIMDGVTVNQRVPGCIFTCEMSSEKFMERMIAARAGVNIRDLQRGYIYERDFPKIANAAALLGNAPLYIVDSGGLELNELISKMRQFVSMYGVKVFGLDYLQLFHSKSKKAQQNRQVEIGEISSAIKAATMDLNVSTILLSQLNRENTKEKKTRKPRISDLRESGQIEQDADTIILLHRMEEGEDEQSPNRANAAPYEMLLMVEKQRNGPTGNFYLTFVPQYTRFQNSSKINETDVAPARGTESTTTTQPAQPTLLPPDEISEPPPED